MGVVCKAPGAPLQEPEVGRGFGKDWELVERKEVLLWGSGLGKKEWVVGGCRGKNNLLRTKNLEMEVEYIFFFFDGQLMCCINAMET